MQLFVVFNGIVVYLLLWISNTWDKKLPQWTIVIFIRLLVCWLIIYFLGKTRALALRAVWHFLTLNLLCQLCYSKQVTKTYFNKYKPKFLELINMDILIYLNPNKGCTAYTRKRSHIFKTPYIGTEYNPNVYFII